MGVIGARANAEPITVNTTLDTVADDPNTSAEDAEGNISLRSAIMRANVNNDNDLIEVPAGTYMLTIDGANEDAARTGDLDLTEVGHTVTIRGAGADQTIIDAGGENGLGDRVIDVVFAFDPVVTVEIDGVTITGGRSPDGADSDDANFTLGDAGADGGGVRNMSTLRITSCIVRGNTAGNGGSGFVDGGNGGSGGNGGGIASTVGTLTINETVITDNRAGNGGNGFDPNDQRAGGGAGGSGGGIINSFGTLRIQNSTISANQAGNGGRGFDLTGTGIGGLGGPGGSGGGIVYAAVFSGETTLTNSTVSGNTAGNGGNGDSGTDGRGGGGGGIVSFGTRRGAPLMITNSTVTGNTTGTGPAGNAGGDGGGIWNDGHDLVLVNTIIAGNSSASGVGPDVLSMDSQLRSAFVTSQGFNLIGNNADFEFVPHPTDQVGTPVAPIDPRLHPLADNGGPTPTHALMPDSSAIDAGKDQDAIGDPTGEDQRGLDNGFNRPVDIVGVPNAVGGDGSDIGAFEARLGEVCLGELECDGESCTRDICDANDECVTEPWREIPMAEGGCNDDDPCTLDLCDRINGTFACDNRFLPGNDDDRDGLPNHCDNCIFAANPDQADTDGDGFGNACDADKDGDCDVDSDDLAALIAAFGTEVAECDLNGDGVVGTPDLAILVEGFGDPPGPSGLVLVCEID